MSTKRTASTSPEKQTPVKKAPRIDAAANDFDEFDDGLDADALNAATAEAEKEAIAKGTLKSSPVASGSTVKATPPSAAAVTPLSHGDDRIEAETMDAEWYARVKEETSKPYFRSLKAFLRAEANAKKVIYPPAELIHSWSRLTPLSQVKVVVVGQDPYHGPGQACGHSFSVPKGVNVPGSLQNIYKELVREYGSSFTPPKHGCLDGWARQGVLLLNACLTVGAGQAGSHHNKGWEPFTQAILKAIAKDASNAAPKASIKQSSIATMFGKAAASGKASAAPTVTSTTTKKEPSSTSDDAKPASKGVVFLAWGLPAAKTLAEAGITEKSSSNILLLKSAHPSPLSAHRGFLGNGHFKAANDWLEQDSRYGPGSGIKWGEL